MGNSRRLAVGLWTLLLSGVGACVSQGDACGGPTSDLPVCGGEREPPTSGASDAGVSGDTDGGDTCMPQPIECEGAVTPLDVKGTSPSGPVVVTGVALHYRVRTCSVDPSRLCYWASLSFLATINGQPDVLRAYGSHVVNVMEHSGGRFGWGADPYMPLSLSGTCALWPDEYRATLEFYARDPVSLAPGGGGVMVGELSAVQDGWNLIVPFEISQACSQSLAPALGAVDGGT